MRLLVLDDLTQDDAKEYFLTKIPDDRRSLFKSDCECFDTVFNMTGGRMVFIDQYVHEVIQDNALLGNSSEAFTSSDLKT